MTMQVNGTLHDRDSVNIEVAATRSRSDSNDTAPLRPHEKRHPRHLRYLKFVLFALILLWIVIQLLMAQIQQNQQATMASASYFLGAFRLSLNPNSASAGVAQIKDADTSHQIRIDDGYVFIFYFLLGILFLVMLPSWCRSTIGSAKCNRNRGPLGKGKGGAKLALVHGKLLRIYLPVYLLATCADWLQGPYKYALYSSYGYSQKDIAHLFVAGYGSGMVLGSIVGGLADSYGRKRLCLCYCFAYTFSVLMKHFRHFQILLLGRVGGGVATSLLFSVFESWLICAHRERGLGRGCDLGKDENEEERWLAKSLSLANIGSSLVAIGSGVLANFVVENSGKMRPLYGSFLYAGGYISAFDVCLVPLALCALLIIVLWEENYGAVDSAEKSADVASYPNVHGTGHVASQSTKRGSVGYLKKRSSIMLQDIGRHINSINENVQNDEECRTFDEGESVILRDKGFCSTLTNGIHTVWNTHNILICCIVGSVFEGAMYIFVFLWTPALTTLQINLDDSHVIIKRGQKDSRADGDLPFGWIFSSFMVCCMLGTTAFSRLSSAGVPASRCLTWILALSSLSSLLMACPHSLGEYGNATTSANTLQYLGMLVYEFCIGFYYPAMGTVKGGIVPEDQRAAIYNVFRLPLNLIVLVYLVGDFSTETSFLANSALLMAAFVLQIWFVRGSGGVSHSKDHYSSKHEAVQMDHND